VLTVSEKRVAVMNPDILLLRAAVPSDAPVYGRLMSHGFAGPDFERRFAWQYFNELDHSTLFIAEVAGEPVGMSGVELRPLSNGWLSGAMIDVVVAPAWRRRGVLRAVAGAIESHARSRGAFVLTSLVNSAGAAAVENIAGWSVRRSIPILRRATAPAFAPEPAYEGIAPGSDAPVRFERSDRYRRWRFAEHPFYRYLFAASSDGTTAVLKLFGSPPNGDIVEVFGALDDMRSLESAYRAATSALFAAGAADALIWGALPQGERELLGRLGWREDAASGRFLAVKVLDDAATFLNDARRWRIQPADIEHY
jgi:GNAT superfamily N-acetyltransferase